MSSFALFTAVSTLLNGFIDHRRSLRIVIDRALAVVRRGLVKSHTGPQVTGIRYPLVYIPPPPPPPPPPTRTIPWDVPGTPTIPSGDYQAPFALWVISSLTALATFVVVLSLLARFGARRQLVKIVDVSLACLYFVFAICVLVPFALLVRGVGCLLRSAILLLHLSTTPVALSFRQIQIKVQVALYLLDNAKVHLLLGVSKATANVSSGNKYIVAPLVLLIAIGLEVVDNLQDVIHKYCHTERVHETVLDANEGFPPDPHPPDLHFDDPPARYRPTIVDVQEIETAASLKTNSYATAPSVNAERPSFDNAGADSEREADPPDAAPDEDTFWGRERWRAKTIPGLLSHLDPALLRIKDQLGSGAFGDVIKVEIQNKITGGVYAVKRIDRAQHSDTESSVVREVGCHLRMAHNAVVPVVHGFFEDTKSLYVIMDCGRRCFSSLITSLTVESARFFAAQLVSDTCLD
ncbi:hypothetical protein FB45DRAFT_181824 [Roridomyces roridus]|uniref:Protein kinase domain-containing protein n=1 Tax=Roridomyces roridus TaxID=1738132 RepID=A0AAD7FYP0_9AGAR|nr:hypothetical protein FB45DRAFT_181824 [Roridomyces roridus]